MKRAAVLVCACLFASCGPQQGSTRTGGNGVPDGGYGPSCTAPPKDSDGDGISDQDEGKDEKPPRDSDGDGTPDYLDSDSDGDGIPDAVEGGNANPCAPPVDTDSDGKPDFVDLDSDDAMDATVPDREEAGPDPVHPVDTDGDGIPDFRDDDNDGDGIADRIELTPAGAVVAATKLANAPDTDGDGIPDFLDTDSDGDGIPDVVDGAVDTDNDLVANYRDLDSDGDCIPDAIEGAVDTDSDGSPDFADADSDNDGLVDGKEDKNCNGTVDACETDRKKADTDGDGVSDLVEVADCNAKPPAQQALCMCDGSSPTSSPLTHGDFVFVVDYDVAPTPTSETLNLSTDVAQADVLFVFDTTASQSSAISAVATGLQGIVSTVQSKVKNIAFGVMQFRDVAEPSSTRLAGGDGVFEYDYRITTANTPSSPTVAAVQSVIGGLTANGGGDSPEGGWLALYAAAGGPTVTVGSYYTSVINLGATNPTTPPVGETQGTLGGAGFRSGSVPIVVTVSDAGWHDAYGTTTTTPVVDAHAGYWTYGLTYAGTPSRHTTVAALQGLGAHLIGVGATDASGATGDSTSRMVDTAYDTGAVVTPADFGSTRPAGCSATQCCTGVSGAGVAADGNGKCPLAFQYDDGNGSGIGSAVSSGIVALANGLKFDIHVEAKDVDPMTVDNFMLKLVPNLSGAGPAAMCITMTPTALQDNFTGPKATPGADGVPDTFPGISGGNQICFDVVPKMNTTVMATDAPQMFHAQLQVKGVAGSNTVNLGVPRDVFFLVPPHIKNGPIP